MFARSPRVSPSQALDIDKPLEKAYKVGMRHSGRLIISLLITAFTAISIAHAANATVMSLKQASVAKDDMVSEMSDCAACPADSAAGAVACDLACTFSFSATLPVAALVYPNFAAVEHVEMSRDASVRSRSPDPHPPRSSLLA